MSRSNFTCRTFVTLVTAVLGVSCSRQSGDPVAVGEMVLVRLNVTGSTVLMGFMMCDEHGCNKMELWGVSEKHRISFKNFVDCGADGYGGVQTAKSPSIDREFLPSFLLVLSRHDEVVSLWLQEAPEAVVTLPISREQQRLYIKDHWMESLSPGSFTFEFLEDNSWRRECFNGGWYNRALGACSCPPGFDGLSCEIACGPDRYGAACARACSGTARGCRRSLLVWDCDTGSGCKICAAGFHGNLCDKICGAGQYGSGCFQKCGQCHSASPCDVYTGRCPSGCAAGYHGATCHHELTHLIIGPNITSVSGTSFSGHFYTTPENLEGSEAVMYYEVQYKLVDNMEGQWVTGVLAHLGNSSATLEAGAGSVPHFYNFTVDGLRPGQALDVRVVLLDRQLQGFSAVPHVRVTTHGERFIFDLTVFEVTSHGAKVAWTSSGNQTFVVRYACERLLACPESCFHSRDWLFVDGRSATLTGLLPGAVYNVLVSSSKDELQRESASIVTAFAVPDVLIDPVADACEACDTTSVAVGTGVVSRTNTSATVQWTPPRDCARLNGPHTGYHWQLLTISCPDDGCPQRSGTTRSTSVVLLDLLPSTLYELRVSLVNTVGFNPLLYASIYFNTCGIITN
ncbi:sushi, nidogen and EGF-like domain-containing protein 1 isoform X2 [Thrips palmi]|uniref:Sushi, nidogen and EGF-like domain-containing protein 1 isoform X2 n=1 Tax=Thrips palmi TaxID=161013 RepID=A0A6P8YXU4_THRPL|nr:sushi, nidogen and EGF-like domain-containing protein 1 isoform X2 [Thrips palmi]